MASRRPSGGEGSSGEGADALGGAFHQVAQGLLRVQEALRLQEQKAATALREAVCQMERKLEERDETIRNLLGAFSARMQAVEERVTRIEERMVPSVRRDGSEVSGGNGNLEQLEIRMVKLEAGVQSALCNVFPRMDALVTQLEETFPQCKPSASDSSAHSAPPSRRPPAASALGATAMGGAAAGGREEPVADHQGAAVLDEERARQRMHRRLREVKARRSSAQTAPSPLGEQLCRASYNGKLEEVQLLLDSGADVNYINSDGRFPLVYAIIGGDVGDLMSLLLERGADANAMDVTGWTALHYAAINDRSGRLVALLIGAGADMDVRNTHGATPLHSAAHYNEAGVCALLAAGARKSLKGWSSRWANKTPFDMAKSHAVRELLRQERRI